MRIAVWTLAALTGLVWLLPVHFVLAMLLAKALGCTVTEAGPTPCSTLGHDIGTYLAVTGVSGWGVIALLPFMLASLVAWLVLGIVALVRRWRR